MEDRSNRDRIRQIIAGAIAGWLAIIAISGISLMVANRLWSPVVLADRSPLELLRDIAWIITPPLVALVGSVIGFYFAGAQNDRAPKPHK